MHNDCAFLDHSSSVRMIAFRKWTKRFPPCIQTTCAVVVSRSWLSPLRRLRLKSSQRRTQTNEAPTYQGLWNITKNWEDGTTAQELILRSRASKTLARWSQRTKGRRRYPTRSASRWEWPRWKRSWWKRPWWKSPWWKRELKDWRSKIYYIALMLASFTQEDVKSATHYSDNLYISISLSIVYGHVLYM